MRFGSTVGRRVKLQASCVEERKKEKKREGKKGIRRLMGSITVAQLPVSPREYLA